MLAAFWRLVPHSAWSLVELFLVCGAGYEFAEGSHCIEDVAAPHGSLHAEESGNELGSLVLEIDTLADFELPQRDAVVEVFDKIGEQRVMKRFAFQPDLAGRSGHGMPSLSS